MFSSTHVNRRAYRFSTERLASDAGLRTPPRLSYGLPIVLPEDTIVRGHRVVDVNGQQYVEWSPNAQNIPYNPGNRYLSEPSTWPFPSRERTLRRVDGSLGRFDYSRFPQFGEKDVWGAAMLAASDNDAAPVPELQPIFQLWSCEADLDHGQFSTAIVNELRVRRETFEQKAAAAKRQLEDAPYSRVTQKLRTSRPSYPRSPTADDLSNCSTFEDAVDLGATFMRVSLSHEAYGVMASEAAVDPLATTYDLPSVPPAEKHRHRQGRWLHGLSREFVTFMLRHGYPAYLVHPSTLGAYVDNAETDWLGMSPRQVDWTADWLAFSAQAEFPIASSNEDMTMRAPIIEHAWLMDNADPSNYGFALQGEDVGPRRTPATAPMPEDVPGGSRPRAVPPPEETRPVTTRSTVAPSSANESAAPPSYSTVPAGQDVAMEEDEDGVRYVPPAPDIAPVQREFVMIDPHRVPYIQAPNVQALARRNAGQPGGLMRFILREVQIQGQTRLVARYVGARRDEARNGYAFEDRVNRRMIVFPHPPHLNWPGVVDGDRYGYPAPNVVYYGLANDRGESRPTRPSHWMYALNSSGARNRGAPVGAVPPRPGPEQLPPLSENQRNIFAMSPLDARASDYWSEQYEDADEFQGHDDEEMDLEAEDTEPLPLYPGRAAAVTEDQAMDTSEDFASPDASMASTRPAPAPSHAATSTTTPPPERSNTPPGPPLIPVGNAQGPAIPSSSAANKGKGRADAMDTTSDDGVRDPSPGPATQNERAPRGRTEEFTRRVGRGQRDSLALAGYSPRGEAPAQGSPLLPRTMVVRDLRRWANAADLEYAIRTLMDSVGERGLGLLRALSVGTGEPDHTGQTPTFDVYFTFDTVRDAALAIENAGRPWVFPTTGRRTRNAPADTRFYAFNIELVSEEAVTEAERGADVLRYPWFSLYAGSTHTARTWDRQALAAQPNYRPPSPRPSEPARFLPTPALQSATPASTTCASTEPSSSSSSTSSAAMSGGLFEIETRIDFALGTVTISIDDLPRLSQMGVDVASAEARLDLGQGTATLPLDTMVRVFAPRAHSSSASSHKTLEDRLSDPRRGSRDSETSSDKRKRRRRRGYTPPSTLPWPSRRRTPSPPPPPAALASRIS